jgi:hypothetical protein
MENIIAEFFTIYAADGLTGPFWLALLH